MFMKKYWKQILGVLVFIFVASLIVLVINYKNSAKFARLELAIAAQNNDASMCKKYYDFDKIIDSYILEYYKKIDDNPFAGWGYSIIENMRPVLVSKLKADIISTCENTVSKKVNIFTLLYRNIFDKSDLYVIKVKKFGNKKEKFYKCTKDYSNCSEFVWEKVDKEWKITDFSLNIDAADAMGKK